jgi:hypothetical protein
MSRRCVSRTPAVVAPSRPKAVRERGEHLVLDRRDVAHQRPETGRREHAVARRTSRP